MEKALGLHKEWLESKGKRGVRFSYIGCDFSEEIFKDAVLDWACMEKCNLRGACLSGASLKSISLRYSDLRFACLRDSDLSFANLTGACFLQADLRNVNLSGAILTHTDLRGANLKGANLSDAWFQAALGDAEGIPTVDHIADKLTFDKDGLIVYKYFGPQTDYRIYPKREPGLVLTQVCNPCRTTEDIEESSGIKFSSISRLAGYRNTIPKANVKLSRHRENP